jgi:[acyl-carrier-protein] S-malonyltransferase
VPKPEAAGGAGEVVEPVNFNGPGQTVIAGSKAAVERACAVQGAWRQARAVAAGFRALPLLADAAGGGQAGRPSGRVEFCAPQMPVINNADVAIESDPDRIKDALVRQAYSPVRWVETIRKMAAMDITTVAECGPGKVLAGLTKRCADSLTSVALADLAAMEAAVANLE